MTSPSCENLTIVRGDDWTQVFEFDQPVSGFSEIMFTMRADYAAPTDVDNSGAIFSAGLGTGVAILGGFTVQLDITHAQTLTFTALTYFYDIQVTTAVGKIYTTQRGQVRIIPDVTR